MRYCTEDEIEDYDDDEDSVDCEIPPSTAPKFTYPYNDERICPVGTNCTSGNKCGPRGNDISCFLKTKSVESNLRYF